MRNICIGRNDHETVLKSISPTCMNSWVLFFVEIYPVEVCPVDLIVGSVRSFAHSPSPLPHVFFLLSFSKLLNIFVIGVEAYLPLEVVAMLWIQALCSGLCWSLWLLCSGYCKIYGIMLLEFFCKHEGPWKHGRMLLLPEGKAFLKRRFQLRSPLHNITVEKHYW